ncbi:hypothetical protein VRK_08830 [Vibrio sp. MEBiC08052]|nr:hypothetical protein VRK_08830 [Vibrio sp. MEBiC08052]
MIFNHAGIILCKVMVVQSDRFTHPATDITPVVASLRCPKLSSLNASQTFIFIPEDIIP